MSKIRRVNLSIACFLVFAFIGPFALGFAPVIYKSSFYPFFTFKLFGHPNFTVFDYSLVLVEVDGKKIDPPRDYFHYFRKKLKLERVYSVPHRSVQEIALTFLGEGEFDLDTIRKNFERRYFFGKKQAKYLLVSRKWDPLEEWNNRNVSRPAKYEKVIAEFQFGDVAASK